jgi:aminopeptidase N
VSKENGGLNSAVPLKSQTWDVPRQFFIMKTSQTLKKGQQYEVQMRFTGHLNDLLQGFYRSSYQQDNQSKYNRLHAVGVKQSKYKTHYRWIATTQFQPTDARQAFPCFDEPALKAKFKISLARPKELSAISNMPKKMGQPESV